MINHSEIDRDGTLLTKDSGQHGSRQPNRRRFLGTGFAAATLFHRALKAEDSAAVGTDSTKEDSGRTAQVAITLDLEMSQNYPTWEQTHWNYEKGNLDAATKEYAVEAARRVKAKGGRIHFFALGQTMEQENVDWLLELIREGHPVGNHTYDHVNLLATAPDQVQFRFRRAPWLMGGKSPQTVIADNIRLAEEALQSRLGIRPRGFRTPGGFQNGLLDRPDLQKLLLDCGYQWVSSLYAGCSTGQSGQPPGEDVLQSVVDAQAKSQPFVYPSGLIEIPMSPISDVGAMRSGRWPLESFLEATRRGLNWVIDHQAVYDFLAHPSCLVVTDPEFRLIDLICETVASAGPERARLADLDEISQRAVSPIQ
ncbi:MAG: polysaccharide deacetylase family protein [Planctomyces sp.]